MTPKEKALALVEKYKLVELAFFYTENNAALFSDSEAAKQCALIAVDELLSIEGKSDDMHFKWHLMFWKQVKEEINKT